MVHRNSLNVLKNLKLLDSIIFIPGGYQDYQSQLTSKVLP